MDNTNRNKVNLVLYIVLALIIVAVVCMTVFSVVTGSKKGEDIQKLPDVTRPATKTPEASSTRRPEAESEPEGTYVELPDEDVDAQPEDPSTPVDAPVKLVFGQPVADGLLLKGYDIDMPVYSVTMNDYRVHAGIDILASAGDPVMAIAEGTVENIYNDALMGNCISISHPNGMVSYYMGLSEEVGEGIEEGAPVYCGQVISSIGDSTLIEIAEEPHLHLEIKQNGEYVNPSDHIFYASASAATDEIYED